MSKVTDRRVNLQMRKDSRLEDCTLCPRQCHVNRVMGQKGYCKETADVVVARAALHMWEETCISGKDGSGAVFFAGCNMGCVFCQNYHIARNEAGKKISVERIQAELVKLLESPHPDWLRKAWETGITAVILPEFDRMMDQPQNNAHHIYSVGEHTLETMRQIPENKVLRLTMLMHDMGKTECAVLDEKGIYHFHGHAAYSADIAKKLMKRLKFDNETAGQVYRLVACHSLYPEAVPEGVRKGIYQIGEELFPLFLEVKRADVMGQSPAVRQAKLSYLDQVRRIYEEILERGDCLSLRSLAVTGNDLIRDGVNPCPALGDILNKLLEEVLEHPEKNEKEYLLEKSRSLR